MSSTSCIIDATLDKCRQRIRKASFLQGMVSIPDFPSLQASPELFFTSYSKVIETYNQVCTFMSDMTYTKIALDRLLQDLQKTQMEYTQQDFYIKEIKKLKDEAHSFIEAYKIHKEALEATARFYNSVQYTLSAAARNSSF